MSSLKNFVFELLLLWHIVLFWLTVEFDEKRERENE